MNLHAETDPVDGAAIYTLRLEPNEQNELRERGYATPDTSTTSTPISDTLNELADQAWYIERRKAENRLAQVRTLPQQSLAAVEPIRDTSTVQRHIDNIDRALGWFTIAMFVIGCAAAATAIGVAIIAAARWETILERDERHPLSTPFPCRL